MNGAPDEAGVQKDEVGDFLLLGVITKGRRSMEIESKTTDDTYRRNACQKGGVRVWRDQSWRRV